MNININPLQFKATLSWKKIYLSLLTINKQTVWLWNENNKWMIIDLMNLIPLSLERLRDVKLANSILSKFLLSVLSGEKFEWKLFIKWCTNHSDAVVLKRELFFESFIELNICNIHSCGLGASFNQ